MHYFCTVNGDPSSCVVWGKKERERERERNINIYTLSRIKWIAVEKFLCSAGSPIWHSVMTWSNEMHGGEGGFGRRNVCILMVYIDVYICILCVVVWQKPTQHCKKKLEKRKNLNRHFSKDKLICEKMLNIRESINLGNANLNHNVISLHTC